MYQRRSIRLKGYDYAQDGAYYVTICTYKKTRIFGEVVEEEMRLNEIGDIVEEEWQRTPKIRPEVELDEFIVMPNHLHGIVIIKDHPVGPHRHAAGEQPKENALVGTYRHTSPMRKLETGVGRTHSSASLRK